MRSEWCSLVIGLGVLGLLACPERREPAMDTVARAERATDAGMPSEPDNTGVNVRDRAPDAVTPLDQSNDEADVEVTRSIREAIANTDAMSLNARNVKVIAENGVVTLRGPVDGELEKQAIVSIAMRTPGVTRVDDQLEVARN